MIAKIGEETVKVWQVSRDEVPDKFIQDLLDKNQLVWKKDTVGPLLRVPKIEEHQKGKFLGELAAMRLGGVGEIIARIGDYLIQGNDGNLKVVTEKQFKKNYQII
ncbi:hypothetical protein ABUK63_03510 [Lactococcus lactis]|uniref:hypothetical protein n=1 Tax=Lactococcus lactis TaxID=1358 RepID=UPI00202635F5|nr:hypothetical protein [Lactococcus lactis]MCL9638860.1 hypothetical protein [Lactococcus lactis]